MTSLSRLLFLFPVLVVCSFPQQTASARPDSSTHRRGGDPPKLILALGDTSTDSYQHESVSHALATMERAGLSAGLFDTLIRTDTQLVTNGAVSLATGTLTFYRNLTDFDAIFLFTSGSPRLTPEQKNDLLAFVRGGKGLVAVHSALGSWGDWPEFADLIGGHLTEKTSAVEERTVKVLDTGSALLSAFPRPFRIRDNFAEIRLRTTGDLHILATSDEVPVVWTKNYGAGRVFASQLGHEDGEWDRADVRAMYLEALRWVMKMPAPPERHRERH